jgi:hypothetical protein
VRDPEPLLLVDDHKAEFFEGNVARQHAVRADQNVHRPRLDRLDDLLLLLRRAKAREQLDARREGGEARAECLVVLIGEDCRRGKHGHLPAVHDGLERGPHRDLSLAVADVATEQAVHRRRLLHVALHVGDGRRLIGRQFIREGRFELLLPGSVAAEGVAFYQPALGVKLQQFLRHVAHRAFGAGLRLLPSDPPQTVQRRSVRIAAGIFLDQVESLDRRVKLRAVGVSQQHELALAAAVVPGRGADHPRVDFGRGFGAGSVQLNQPLELAYAVVDVYDVIADLQVAEIGEECGGL